MTDDLRHRYAEAIANAECEKRPRCVTCTADAVMAVRDDELEQLRLIAKVNNGLHRSAEKEAVQASAAVARVRALHKPFQRRDKVPYCDHCSVSAGTPWRRYVLVPWPCDTLAALDDTKPETP